MVFLKKIKVFAYSHLALVLPRICQPRLLDLEHPNVAALLVQRGEPGNERNSKLLFILLLCFKGIHVGEIKKLHIYSPGVLGVPDSPNGDNPQVPTADPGNLFGRKKTGK